MRALSVDDPTNRLVTWRSKNGRRTDEKVARKSREIKGRTKKGRTKKGREYHGLLSL